MKDQNGLCLLILHQTYKDNGVQCGGCLSDNVFGFCKVCSIKDCTKSKGYSGCHECEDFPCQYIEEFPMPVGKKVILRAIPYWREHGTEKYVGMKRLDTSVLGVATSCSGVRNGVTNVRLLLILIELFLSMDDLTIVKNKICLTMTIIRYL
jgi:hypothetical protein